MAVPHEMRQISSGAAADSISLMEGAEVEAVGPPIAPRSGAFTVDDVRVAATAIVVNGKSAGAQSFAAMRPAPSFTYTAIGPGLNSAGG